MKTPITCIKKETIANGTMAFYFKKPEHFDFRAGQFADFTLINPAETDTEGNTRAFSLITAPYEDVIGFATRMRDTAFKRNLEHISENSEIIMDGPFGNFTLHKNSENPAVYIIGGIGVTPVLSMIKQATYEKSNHHIVLFHANKTESDAPFQHEFMNLEKNNKQFSFIQVFSDEQNNSNQESLAKKESGYMNETILKKYVNDIHAPIYYLSGPEPMVTAMRSMLVNLGIDEDTIKTEEFSGY